MIQDSTSPKILELSINNLVILGSSIFASALILMCGGFGVYRKFFRRRKVLETNALPEKTAPFITGSSENLFAKPDLTLKPLKVRSQENYKDDRVNKLKNLQLPHDIHNTDNSFKSESDATQTSSITLKSAGKLFETSLKHGIEISRFIFNAFCTWLSFYRSEKRYSH